MENNNKRLTARENLHQNHRQSMLTHYLSGYAESIPDHVLIEMLLYYSIPRKDTNATAHMLLDHFGSFSGLLNAPIEQLTATEGVGIQSARLIKLAALIKNKYNEDVTKPRKRFSSLDELADFARLKLQGIPNEQLLVIVLDSSNNLISHKCVANGTADFAGFNIRKIIETALACSGSKLAVAHNHPSDNVQPSESDISSTQELRRTCDMIGLMLYEHLVITQNAYTPILTYVSELQKKQMKKYI